MKNINRIRITQTTDKNKQHTHINKSVRQSVNKNTQHISYARPVAGLNNNKQTNQPVNSFKLPNKARDSSQKFLNPDKNSVLDQNIKVGLRKQTPNIRSKVVNRQSVISNNGQKQTINIRKAIDTAKMGPKFVLPAINTGKHQPNRAVNAIRNGLVTQDYKKIQEQSVAGANSSQQKQQQKQDTVLRHNKQQELYNFSKDIKQQQNIIEAIGHLQLQKYGEQGDAQFMVNPLQQVSSSDDNKKKQQQQDNKKQAQLVQQIKIKQKQQEKRRQKQQQNKKQQQTKQLLQKINKRRAQRQQQKKRLQQINQKRQLEMQQAVNKIGNGSGNTTMLFSNDNLDHFQMNQAMLNAQINIILQNQTQFNNLPDQIRKQIQGDVDQLRKINDSYLMIRDDPNNTRMTEGLNGYRIQLFNKIGSTVLSNQNNQLHHQNNQNGISIMNVDSNSAPSILAQANLTRGISKNKASHFSQPAKCTTEDTCAICLMEFQQNQIGRKLDCNHIFHNDCLEEWLQTSANCPSCRHNIKFPS